MEHGKTGYVQHKIPKRETRVTIIDSAPHSGTRIPAILARHLRLDIPDVVRTVGTCIDHAAPHACDLGKMDGSHVILVDSIRLLDLNRSGMSVSGSFPELDSRFVDGVSNTGSHPHGLLWGVSVPVVGTPAPPEDSRYVSLYDGKLSKPEFIELFRIYQERRVIIEKLLKDAKSDGRPAVVREFHSFPANLPGRASGTWNDAYYLGPGLQSGRFQERRIPDVIVVDGGHTDMKNGEQVQGSYCAGAISNLYFEALSAQGLVVQRGPQGSKITGADNGATVEFGNVNNGVSVIGVEIVSRVLEPRRDRGADVNIIEGSNGELIAEIPKPWESESEDGTKAREYIIKLQTAFRQITDAILSLPERVFFEK